MKRLLLAALLITGCGPSTQKTTIAVIPKGTTHVFWKSVHAGAVKAGQELGVEVIWKGPLKEDDREDQIKVVENFVNQRVSGIVLAPLDDAALVGPVEDAARAKIPVVIIDSDLKSEKHVSFVATDNVKGGELAGQEMARLLGGKGKVVLLRYQEGSASTMNREKGFLDALAKHPGIEVVSKDQYAGATTATAIAASENLLQRYKAAGGLSVDGLFCPNESSAAGMLTVLQSSGLAGKVKFIGFDSSVQLLKAIEDGQLHATVVQDPITMGYLGVKSMVRRLRGETVERRVDTGATLVTPANLKEPRIRDLVDPDAFKKWLKE
jgi:ribose transport system substrate-binding protein